MENETSLWSKKQDELTVADTLKVAGLTTVVGVVAPFAILMVVGSAVTVRDKIQARRAAKKSNKAK